jgi:hypothetical protein
VPPDKGWRCPPQGSTQLPPLGLQPVTALGVAVHWTEGDGVPVKGPNMARGG